MAVLKLWLLFIVVWCVRLFGLILVYGLVYVSGCFLLLHLFVFWGWCCYYVGFVLLFGLLFGV